MTQTIMRVRLRAEKHYLNPCSPDNGFRPQRPDMTVIVYEESSNPQPENTATSQVSVEDFRSVGAERE